MLGENVKHINCYNTDAGQTQSNIIVKNGTKYIYKREHLKQYVINTKQTHAYY